MCQRPLAVLLTSRFSFSAAVVSFAFTSTPPQNHTPPFPKGLSPPLPKEIRSESDDAPMRLSEIPFVFPADEPQFFFFCGSFFLNSGHPPLRCYPLLQMPVPATTITELSRLSGLLLLQGQPPLPLPLPDLSPLFDLPLFLLLRELPPVVFPLLFSLQSDDPFSTWICWTVFF